MPSIRTAALASFLAVLSAGTSAVASDYFFRGRNGVIEVPPSMALSAMAPSLVVRFGASAAGSVSAIGGTAPFLFTAGGTPPAWLSVDRATGAVSGVPSEPGAWIVPVRVTDARGAQAVTELRVEAVARLALSLPSVAALPGDQVDVLPAATGGYGARAWSFDGEASTRPAWLSIDASTGRLKGTAAAGEWPAVRIRVTDGVETASASVAVSSKALAAFAMRRLGGTGGDITNGVAALRGGGVAVAGQTSSPGGAGGEDIFVASYDGSGVLQWRRSLGGAGSDIANGVAALPSGGVAVTGGTGNVAGAGDYDAFVASYDGTGGLQWRSSLGGTGSDLATGVAALPNGGVAISGYTGSPGGAGALDAFVATYDGSGTLQWRRSIGGTGHDAARSVTALPGGGVAVAGYTNSPGGAGDDAFVATYDGQGTLQWQRSLGGTGDDYASVVASLADGGVAVAGYTTSPGGAGANDAFVAAYDASGTLQWRRALGGTGGDIARGITALPGGGVAVVGNSDSPGGAGGSDAFVAAYDGTGNLLWHRMLGGTGVDVAQGVSVFQGDGLALAGYTSSPGGAGGNDAFVAFLAAGAPVAGTHGNFAVIQGGVSASNPTLSPRAGAAMETGRTVQLSGSAATWLEPTYPSLRHIEN